MARRASREYRAVHQDGVDPLTLYHTTGHYKGTNPSTRVGLSTELVGHFS